MSLLSAFFLGLYEITKKAAVRDNAVPIVLLLNVLTAASLWAVAILIASINGHASEGWLSEVLKVSWRGHIELVIKSVLVGASWICAFYALKRLPISIAIPIRATGPLWTILFAVWVMGERPLPMQWLGIIVVLLAFFAFSRIGAREGIHFHRDPAVTLMVLATLLGSASALYDKYLLQSTEHTPVAVQAWFSIYLVPVMLPLAIRWWRSERGENPFQWRWSIPLIAITLLIADFSYFTALAEPNALISVISPLRRTSVVIAFLFGVLNLKEQNWKSKAVCIAAILVGVTLLSRN